MEVSVPLHAEATGGRGAGALRDILAGYLCGERGSSPCSRPGKRPLDGYLPANALAGSNRLEISVWGNEEQALLVARFDNLGKGASGAAVQI